MIKVNQPARTILKFVECDTCIFKPGSPILCKGCLKNRETIQRLSEAVTKAYPIMLR